MSTARAYSSLALVLSLLETRFAQFFAAHAPQDVNAHLEAGDPVMAVTARTPTSPARAVCGTPRRSSRGSRSPGRTSTPSSPSSKR